MSTPEHAEDAGGPRDGTTRDRSGLDRLTTEESRRLLAEHPTRVGRVAVVDHAGRPMVLPVNYVVDGTDVVFRTGEGTKLDVAARGAPVAFEVDAVDPDWREGWSVVVAGRCEEVVDEDRLWRLRGRLLYPWAPGDRGHYVRVASEPPEGTISGRRIPRSPDRAGDASDAWA